MGMIQQIDGNALINAFRQGRSDRFAVEDRAAKAAKAQREEAQNAEFQSLTAQYFGGGGTGGVAGQFASPSPSANVAAAPTVADAFTPDQMAAVGTAAAQGGVAPVTAPAAAPQAPAQAPQGSQARDPAIFARMMTLDEDRALKIATGLQRMSEVELKQREEQNTYTGSTAMWLLQFPPQERAARFQSVAPMLIQRGLTEAQAAEMAQHLDDGGLDFFRRRAVDVDKMIDNELAAKAEQRQNNEFMAGKVTSVAPGGSMLLTKPTVGADGTVSTSSEYVVGGPQGGSAPPAGVARITGADDYNALPAGARYIDPNGTLRQKPGGPTPSASGGFPGG